MSLDLNQFVMAQLKREELEKKAQLYKTRLLFAKKGVAAFRQGDYKTALQSYMRYFDTLAKAQDLPKNTSVSTAKFDKTKDAGEMLLIASIGFDLMRIYDKASTPEQDREFTKACTMFVDFTKGMVYQPALAEQMRRFLMNHSGRLKHRKEFRETYDKIRVDFGKCYISSYLLGPNHPITQYLRWLRDSVIRRHRWGRRAMDYYYCRSSLWVAARQLEQLRGKT